MPVLPLPGYGPKATNRNHDDTSKEARTRQNQCVVNFDGATFSDITIMFGGLWVICELSGLPFLYMHLLVALITLVVFQMLGGITDFIAHGAASKYPLSWCCCCKTGR